MFHASLCCSACISGQRNCWAGLVAKSQGDQPHRAVCKLRPNLHGMPSLRATGVWPECLPVQTRSFFRSLTYPEPPRPSSLDRGLFRACWSSRQFQSRNALGSCALIGVGAWEYLFRWHCLSSWWASVVGLPLSSCRAWLSAMVRRGNTGGEVGLAV